MSYEDFEKQAVTAVDDAISATRMNEAAYEAGVDIGFMLTTLMSAQLMRVRDQWLAMERDERPADLAALDEALQEYGMQAELAADLIVSVAAYRGTAGVPRIRNSLLGGRPQHWQLGEKFDRVIEHFEGVVGVSPVGLENDDSFRAVADLLVGTGISRPGP